MKFDNKMLRLYNKKYFDKDIAAELEVPFSRVRRWRNDVAKLPPNEKKKVSYILIYQVKKLIKEKMKISDIAEMLDVSDAVVNRAKNGYDQIGVIESLNSKGLNDSKIANKLGCTRQFIAEQRKQVELVSVKRRNIIKRLSVIGKLHKNGLVSRDIAKQVKSDVAYVNRDLRKLKLIPHQADSLRGHSEKVLALMDRIKELNGQGKNDPAIAKKLKFKTPYIVKLRNEMGIPPIRGQKNSEQAA